MTNYPRVTESPIGSTSSVLCWDAKILHDSVREAVRTSPDSFLKTVEDVDTIRSLDYWIDEIRTSTWAVAERAGEVVGVAQANTRTQTRTMKIRRPPVTSSLSGSPLASEGTG